MSETCFTLVCEKCKSGWNSEKPSGDCKRCGKPAQLRGQYETVSLK